MNILKSKRRTVVLFLFLAFGVYSLLIPTEIFPVWLDEAFKQYPYMDKVLHAGLFFSAFVLMHWATHIRRRYLMTLSIIVGLGTELVQLGISGRSGSLGDFLADAGGALTALWLSGVFSVYLATKTRDTIAHSDAKTSIQTE